MYSLSMRFPVYHGDLCISKWLSMHLEQCQPLTCRSDQSVADEAALESLALSSAVISSPLLLGPLPGKQGQMLEVTISRSGQLLLTSAAG